MASVVLSQAQVCHSAKCEAYPASVHQRNALNCATLRSDFSYVKLSKKGNFVLGRNNCCSFVKELHGCSTRNLRLLVRSASTEEAIIDKNELLKDAAKAGDLNKVRELVGTGEVDINLPSPQRSGWTALQLGAFYEHPEVTSYLLWAGADTEVRNSSGNTALQFACLKGNVEITKMLLEAGADIDAASNDKGTPIDYAQEWGGDDIVDFLLMWAAHSRSAE